MMRSTMIRVCILLLTVFSSVMLKADVNILVVGSPHSFSEGNEGGVVKELDLISTGISSKESADILQLTISTVYDYLKILCEKLHVHSRTDAVIKYLGRSLVPRPKQVAVYSPLSTDFRLLLRPLLNLGYMQKMGLEVHSGKGKSALHSEQRKIS
jgi:DNA-binding CsgD family transcriptional regulator